jgi:transcriptional regulator with XRE-family HTH domain
LVTDLIVLKSDDAEITELLPQGCDRRINTLEDIRRMIASNWRARLERAIKDSGRSNREISLAARKSHGYIHSILKEGKDPTVDNLIAICRVLNVSLTKILCGFEMSAETEKILSLIEGNPKARDGILQILRQQ